MRAKAGSPNCLAMTDGNAGTSIGGLDEAEGSEARMLYESVGGLARGLSQCCPRLSVIVFRAAGKTRRNVRLMFVG